MDRPIRELLQRGSASRPIRVDVRITVVEAVRLMNDRGAGSALVFDGDDLVGIFTERDVLRRVVQRGRDAGITTVGEVMTIGPYTVSGESPVCDALVLMRENGVCHLPVTEEGSVRGVIALRDIMSLLAEELEFENRTLLDYIQGSLGPTPGASSS
ncbi:MAG: cyclic nucleotide-binding/CBS domain-containing protein [Sandaracinaceae bacterium]